MDMNCVEVAFKAGVEGRYPERRVTIGRVANLTAPTDEQIALGRGKCQNRNLCMRGCPFGAYFSSNSATLVAAERTGNLTLRPNSIATSVIYDAKKGRATGVQVIDAVTREVLTFQAEVIFVCASSMNSAWILMNSTSARFPEGLGNDSDQLGRNLMDQHSRVGAAADAPGYEDKYYSGRRPNGLYIPRFRNLGDKATARTDYLRGFGFQGGAARLGWERSLPGEGFSVSRTADAVAGIGAARKAALSQPGPWTMRLSGYGEILPHPDNRVRLNRDIQDGYGLPTLTFDARLRENELAMRRDMQVAAAEMLEAAGFRNIQTYDNPYAPGMGIHEMGAARMGRDPKTSVLNGHNQVHGCRNVYVTDGAAMTSASSVNPSLTYMALTARAVAHAVQARRKGEL